MITIAPDAGVEAIDAPAEDGAVTRSGGIRRVKNVIIEALAQVDAVAILSLDENKGKIAFFGGINKCRFKGKVKPGDKLRLETKIIRHKGPMGVGEAVASVDGKVVAQAELTFMVGAAQ